MNTIRKLLGLTQSKDLTLVLISALALLVWQNEGSSEFTPIGVPNYNTMVFAFFVI